VKKIITILTLLLVCSIVVEAQHIPSGMTYQAVARDLDGKVMANTAISLKVDLVAKGDLNKYKYKYEEEHFTTTNQLGLFTLILGEGDVVKGVFKDIPWSTDQIWLELSLDEKGGQNFTMIHSSKLLAVPYAFHAGTADVLTTNEEGIEKGGQSKPWFVEGNEGTDPDNHFVGNVDSVDLVFRTNDLERMRIMASGRVLATKFHADLANFGFVVIENDLRVYENLNVDGLSTLNELEVENDVRLNTQSGSTVIDGPTMIHNTLDVDASTHLNIEGGSTVVEGATTIHNTLDVDGASTLNNTLDVDGITTLNNDLDVDGNTTLNNTLDVDGVTTLNNALDVDGVTTLNNALDVDGVMTLNNALDVDGVTTLNNNLDVDGVTTLNNNLDVDGVTTLNNSLDVDGVTTLNNSLDVDGVTTLNNALDVDGVTTLNNALDVDGVTTLNNDLDVDGNTTLNNTLDVDGVTTLNNALDVDGVTTLNNALDVDGVTTLNNSLDVDGVTTLNDALDVDGATTLNDDLDVNGVTTLNDKLVISNNIPDGEFALSVENTNGGVGGDGIQIKLGKTHPAWDGGDYLNVTNPYAEFFDGSIQTVRGWVEGDAFEFKDLLNFIPAAVVAGTICELTEELVEPLNDGLSLPLDISTPINNGLNLPFDISTPINDGLDLPLDLTAPINDGLSLPLDFPGVTLPYIGIDLYIGSTGIGPFTLLSEFELLPELPALALPALPNLVIPALPNLVIPAIPADLGCDNLPSFSPPNLSFVNVQNSLTLENQFISFVDKDDRELGSISAIGVTDWGDKFFNGVYLVNFLGSSVGLDPLGAVVGALKEFTNIAYSYNSIGVKYSSGHGDYAEWLERADQEEIISRGDIVAVKGGKITKDLEGAEQIMAVSEHPIVLGNMPPEGKLHMGNNVAFMGQIPVKVMGPVQSGDYIIANSTVPGYGIAVHPEDIKVEDTKMIVGRSWETRTGDGPKMVNTVVGVHNGDYFRILQKYEQKFMDSEARFETLESKIDVLSERLDASSN
jgi:hypothetical protein